MKYTFKTILLTLLICNLSAVAQEEFNQKKFFTDTAIIPVTFTTDLGNLTSGKIRSNKQKGRLSGMGEDGKPFTNAVNVSARGNMRKSLCFMPPLKLQFLKDSTSPWWALKTLKLVGACETNSNYEQLLVREYLVYKMYNIITDTSLNVRMMLVKFDDEKGKKKSYTQHAFFIEDVDQMAKRNKCVSVENNKVLTDATDFRHITLTCIFQYMIGNTDWSVPNGHNVRLIRSKKDSFAKPIAVPYDFDYAGIVNAPYAVPSSELSIEFVTQRLYRGFPRTMEQLEPIVQLFKDKKSAILDLVNNCRLLKDFDRKEMLGYLTDFYKDLERPSSVKSIFIDNARRY